MKELGIGLLVLGGCFLLPHAIIYLCQFEWFRWGAITFLVGLLAWIIGKLRLSDLA